MIGDRHPQHYPHSDRSCEHCGNTNPKAHTPAYYRSYIRMLQERIRRMERERAKFVSPLMEFSEESPGVSLHRDRHKRFDQLEVYMPPLRWTWNFMPRDMPRADLDGFRKHLAWEMAQRLRETRDEKLAEVIYEGLKRAASE